MERAVVSTSSGCAGLGLVHGESVWVADSPADFGRGVAGLIGDESKRQALAVNARRLAVERFGWSSLGEKQRGLYRELLSAGRTVSVAPGS
jgi:glycosyltransferase involved in cell wall biosynthesis